MPAGLTSEVTIPVSVVSCRAKEATVCFTVSISCIDVFGITPSRSMLTVERRAIDVQIKYACVNWKRRLPSKLKFDFTNGVGHKFC